MRCSLCGHQFSEEEGINTCKGCPLAGPCHMVRCPNCGYDIPREPKIIRAIRNLRRSNNGIRRKS